MAQSDEAISYRTRQQVITPATSGLGRVRASARTIFTYAVLTLFLVLAVAPFLLIALSAFKSATEIAENIFG